MTEPSSSALILCLHPINFQNIADAFSDQVFIVSAVEFSRKLADAKAKLSGFRSPLGRHYLYLFNHYPTLREGQKELSGTYHSHDVVYEFDPSGMGGGRTWFAGDEYTIASTFRTMLTSFAKTGSVGDCVWRTYSQRDWVSGGLCVVQLLPERLGQWETECSAVIVTETGSVGGCV